MSILESLLSNVDQAVNNLEHNLLVAKTISCQTKTINEIKSQLDFIIKLQCDLQIYTDHLPIQYINNIEGNIAGYKDIIPSWPKGELELALLERSPYDTRIIEEAFGSDEIVGRSIHVINELTFLFNFFKRLNYIQNNMVIIGANGSGKSSLAATLKNYLGPHSLIISAQKLLLIPTFESISNTQIANSALTNQQSHFNYEKWSYTAGTHFSALHKIQDLTNHFKNLIDSLLANRSEVHHFYIESLRSGEIETNDKSSIPETNLDKVIKIWNRLFQHRTLFCKHINIAVKVKDTQEEYEANHMSDGEKVALYYISQILQAPKNSLIIIDEPEMYLHKTILSKLWDILEKERNDCIYMYLTHDIDFAITRNDAKKYWMRSFNYPKKWEINEIENTDELPEHLLLELVGSRKNILFCEGEIGKIDDEIYKILFPNFTVKPVGSCTNVINFTRAFNKIRNLTTQAYGIIDSDHSPKDRSEKLSEDKIYSLQVAEVENLLLEEDLLNLVAEKLMLEEKDKKIKLIKDLITSSLSENIEVQTANYISSEINFYFEEANINKGNTKEEVESNFYDFLSNIKIEEKYNERKAQLEHIISQNNYFDILKIYNHKGLSAKTHNILQIKSYKDFTIRLLKSSSEARESLKKHFPEFLFAEDE